MEDKVAEQPSASPSAEAPKISKIRLKKPIKPDVEEHKAAVEQLQQEMQKRGARLEEIRQILDQKRQNGGGPEVSKAQGKLNDMTSRFKAELEKKKSLREELLSINKQRDTARAKLRELKAKIGGYTTVQKIDEKVAGLDYRITHHTLDLKEENRTREEMKKLTGLKPLVSVYAQEEEILKGTDGARQKVLDQLKAIDEKLNQIKGEEEKQRAQMSELRSKENARGPNAPSLYKERDECRDIRSALYQKIQEMREENRARHQQYWEEQQAWQKQQQEERRLKQVAREKEFAERDAARKAAALEFAGEPYHKEIALCEQLISHLGKYRHQQEAQAPAAAPVGGSEAADAFQGMKAVNKKKGDEDKEEGFGVFYGTGSKKAKGKKGKGAGTSQGGPSDQKLNHSLDIIEAFSSLKVSMPTVASKVPAALKEVEDRKAYWLEKRAHAEENGVVEPEESEAASSSKASKAVHKPKANGVLDFNNEEWPDFAGNVGKGPVTTAASPDPKAAQGGPVTVKLGVEGEKVSLLCTSVG